MLSLYHPIRGPDARASRGSATRLSEMQLAVLQLHCDNIQRDSLYLRRYFPLENASWLTDFEAALCIYIYCSACFIVHLKLSTAKCRWR